MMDDLLVKPAVKSVVSADSAVYNKSVLARRSGSPAAQTVTPTAGRLDAKSNRLCAIGEQISIFSDPSIIMYLPFKSILVSAMRVSE